MLNTSKDYQQWAACLELQFERKLSHCKLSRNYHKGPLYVQKPFYPEGDDLAHTYLLHPPGGLVSGDQLTIDVKACDQAKALLTTPGAARAYRARDHEGSMPWQAQHVHLHLGEQSSIEWFPLETILYNGAKAELHTTVTMPSSAHYHAWEISCFGLPASDQQFLAGALKQRYRIVVDGLPIFIDNLSVNDNNLTDLLSGQCAFNNHTVSGFFIIVSQYLDDQLLDDMREKISQYNWQNMVGVSLLNGCLVARYLGSSAEQAKQIFTALWCLSRPKVLNRKSCEPRIWFT